MNIEQRINNEPSLVEWQSRIKDLIVAGELRPVPHAPDRVEILIGSPEEALNLFRAASIYLSLRTHVFSEFTITVKLAFPDDYYSIDWSTMREVAIVNNELVSNMIGTKKIENIYVDLDNV